MAIKPLIDQISACGTPLVSQFCTGDVLPGSAGLWHGDETATNVAAAARAIARCWRGNESDGNTSYPNGDGCTHQFSGCFCDNVGLHVCSYLAEINRHLIRLQQLYPRAVTGLFGGAVGNLASVGEQGMETRERLMLALGLNVPCGINNASRDAVVEVVQFCPCSRHAMSSGQRCRNNGTHADC